MKSALIIGGGYLGERLVHTLIRDHKVHVITRTLSRHEFFSNLGVTHHALDITNSKFKYKLGHFSTIIFCPAPTVDATKKTAKSKLYVEGLNRILREARVQGFKGTFCIVGSTSCFQDRQPYALKKQNPAEPVHYEVSENTLANTPSQTTQIASDPQFNPSLKQFEVWNRNREGLPFQLHLVISAGIYGPGRHPAKKLIQGLRVTTKNPLQWINLIHIEDLHNIVLASRDWLAPTCVCASNGQPLSLGDFYGMYTSVLDLPEVEFSYGGQPGIPSGKRVGNQKLLESGISLKHPRFTVEFIKSQKKDILADDH